MWWAEVRSFVKEILPELWLVDARLARESPTIIRGKREVGMPI